MLLVGRPEEYIAQYEWYVPITDDTYEYWEVLVKRCPTEEEREQFKYRYKTVLEPMALRGFNNCDLYAREYMQDFYGDGSGWNDEQLVDTDVSPITWRKLRHVVIEASHVLGSGEGRESIISVQNAVNNAVRYLQKGDQAGSYSRLRSSHASGSSWHGTGSSRSTTETIFSRAKGRCPQSNKQSGRVLCGWRRRYYSTGYAGELLAGESQQRRRCSGAGVSAIEITIHTTEDPTHGCQRVY